MEPSPSPQRIVLTAGIFEGGLGLAALALGCLLDRPPWTQFGDAPINALWGLLASLPMLLGLVLSVRYPVGPLRPLRDLTQELVVPMFRNCSMADMAIIAVLAGVGEELLFRGVVQEAIAHRFGPIVGLAAASVLFGLMHPLSRDYAVLTGLVGVYLGGLFLATGSLVAPIVTHAVYDFVALVYLVRWAGMGK
jgi:membrane protease YdiL (CAAX protease family)